MSPKFESADKAWQLCGACKDDVRFSRDEKFDTWCTTTLIQTHKLATRATVPYQA